MRKKVFSLLAVGLFFLPSSINGMEKNNLNELMYRSCFQWARDFVVSIDGSIGIENVGYVVELANYLRTTGFCE